MKTRPSRQVNPPESRGAECKAAGELNPSAAYAGRNKADGRYPKSGGAHQLCRHLLYPVSLMMRQA